MKEQAYVIVSSLNTDGGCVKSIKCICDRKNLMRCVEDVFKSYGCDPNAACWQTDDILSYDDKRIDKVFKSVTNDMDGLFDEGSLIPGLSLNIFVSDLNSQTNITI